MPDLTPEALMKLKPNKRWTARMNHAWTECRGIRHEEMRFFTKHTLNVEEPDENATPINVGTEDKPKMVKPVIRSTDNSKGVIWAWRLDTGEEHKMVVEKSTDYAKCLKAVKDLLSKFKG